MQHKKQRPLYSVMRYAGNYSLLMGVIISALLKSLRNLACIVTLSYATNQVIYGQDIFWPIIFMTIAMFSGSPVNALSVYCGNHYYLNVQKKLQLEMTDKIAGLPLSWVQQHASGSVISTYTADLEMLCMWFSRTLPSIVDFAFYIFGAVIISSTQSIPLTFVVFPVIMLIVPFIMKLSKPLKKTSDTQRKTAAESLSKMQEVLSDPEFLKSYSLEQTMDDRIDVALESRKKAEQKSGFYIGLVRALSSLGSYLPGFVAAAAGVFLLARGSISPGFLVGFVQISIQYFGGALPRVGDYTSSTNRAGASAIRVMELLSTDSERTDGQTSIPASDTVFDLEHVSFSYQRGAEVLTDITLKIKKGETVAFVGTSGSGKSTLIKLLMGLYETTRGTLRVLGRPLPAWNLKALRSLIAPVFQDADLFPMSLGDNIASGTENASPQALESALRAAGLQSFIETLPEGLNTPVGQHGISLSGGQRQRVTIARAYIKNAPIILFDEPTSALDTVTENEFQAAYESLKKGRTTVIVAHRLRTIRDADRIYVFEHGKIVQVGTHESLISQAGAYRRLYQTQAEHGEVCQDA